MNKYRIGRKLKNETHDIYSEKLNKIIETPPSWMIKHGIGLIIIISIILAILAFSLPISTLGKQTLYDWFARQL